MAPVDEEALSGDPSEPLLNKRRKKIDEPEPRSKPNREGGGDRATSGMTRYQRWPDAASRDALLLVPPTTLGKEDGDAGDDEQTNYCRLSFHELSGLVRVVTCPPPPVNDDVGANEGGGGGGPRSVEVLDEFNPDDVIGAELEVRFGGFDSDGWADAALSAAAAAPATDAREEDSDAAAAATAAPPRKFQDSSPTASGLLLSPSSVPPPKPPSRSNRNAAVAYLNVYCYPRPRKGEGGLWSRVCTNPFAGGGAGAEGQSNNDEEYQEEEEEKDSAGDDMGEGGVNAPQATGAAAVSVRSSNPDIDYEHRRAHHRRYEVAPTEDFASVRAVVRAIRELAKLGQFGTEWTGSITKTTPPSSPADADGGDGSATNSTSIPLDRVGPRRYLVVVNPRSGTGKAKAMYENTVRPMLDQSGVEHDVFITERAAHALDRMTESHRENDNGNDDEERGEKDITEYDAIIAMGGDGTLWEMLQGIRRRSDASSVFEKLTFGIVGCGTSNGLAKSILHANMEKYNGLEATFLICKGRTAPVDLSTYETTCGKVYTGFLTFSWAFIADVDLDSECIRFLGSVRNDIWAALRIIANRSYKAKFSYLPGSAVPDLTKPITMPSLDGPVPDDWITVEGDFILFWASQVTHAAHNTFQSPMSQMQDGLFRVMVVRRPISRFRMVQIALAMESGGHVEHDQCEVYECVAYRLEPLERGSHNDLDGEKIEDGPIQAHVLPSAARFFSGTMS